MKLTPTMKVVKRIEALLPEVEAEMNAELKEQTGLDYDDRENWTDEDWKKYNEWLPF